MNQAEILKRLLAEYRLKGGDLGDVAAATVYINLHKPAGIGRVNEVICGAIVRQMGIAPTPAAKPAKAMLDTPPAPASVHHITPGKTWPRITSEPKVIAAKTVSFPAAMRGTPVALYSEKPAEPVPKPAAAHVPPADIAPPPERIQAPKPKPTSFLERLKFWKRKARV